MKVYESIKYYFSTLQFMFQILRFFLVSNSAPYFLPSLQSELSEDDDEEDDAVEANLVGLHQFGHIRAGGGGHRVPQHEGDIAQVQNPHLVEQRRGEEANDCGEDGDHEDGSVPLLEDAAHAGNKKNLKTFVWCYRISPPRCRG